MKADEFRKHHGPQWKKFLEGKLWQDAISAATGGMDCMRVRSLSRDERRVNGPLILSEQQGALDLEHALESLGETFEFVPLKEDYPDQASEADAEAARKRNKPPKKGK
jgi:hypothetical protein